MDIPCPCKIVALSKNAVSTQSKANLGPTWQLLLAYAGHMSACMGLHVPFAKFGVFGRFSGGPCGCFVYNTRCTQTLFVEGPGHIPSGPCKLPDAQQVLRQKHELPVFALCAWLHVQHDVEHCKACNKGKPKRDERIKELYPKGASCCSQTWYMSRSSLSALHFWKVHIHSDIN